jgi:hypothetical protein
VQTAVALFFALVAGAALAAEETKTKRPTPAEQMQRAAREVAESEGLEQESKSSTAETQKDAPLRDAKRPVPDYDGRGPRPTTFGEGALWVPRILASPLYLTTKYVIAAPLGALLTTAEKNDWPTWLYNFFTFGEEHQAGWFPLFFYDFGLRPTVGIYFFWNRAFSRSNSLAATVAFGGTDWIAFGLSAGRKVSKRTAIVLSGSFLRRPDALFYGIGPRSNSDFQSRYPFQRVEGAAALEWQPARWSLLRASVGVRDVKFRNGSCCGDPSVATRVRLGQFPAPPGFDQPYTVLLGRTELAFDSRLPRPAPQSGARLALNVEEDVGTTNTPHSWIRYGGVISGFWDVTGTARVLSLSLFTTLVDPTGGNSIPFTELATLGGSEPFVGFLYGRLYDRSAIAAQLRYEWPIWAFIDGELQVAIGNVFGRHLDGLRAGLMRLSTGIGFRSVRGTGPGVELLVGFGTETFDSGTRVSSFRFALGSTYGF